MSRLRPSLMTSDKPAVPDTTALYLIANAVAGQKGLIHGWLRDGARFCAIGAFFNSHPGGVLRTCLIDEVAAYNDSMPLVTQRERKRRVLKWLKQRIRLREAKK